MNWIVGVLMLVALGPLLVVEIPAMIDYVNHLARMGLLAAEVRSPAYVVHWRLYPNLAMDIAVPLLAKCMPVEVAAKVFLAVSQVLVVTGAIAVERVVKRRHQLAGLSALLVLFSLPFAWGLMNFMFGVGLALWGVAAWIALRGRGPWLRWAVHAAVVAALFLSHFFALGIYGLTIGLYEFAALSLRPWNLWKALGLTAFMASPALAVVAVMVAAGGSIGGKATDWDFGLKLLWPLMFMNVYNQLASVLTGAALVALIAVLAASRRLALTRTGVWIAFGFLLVYLALPRRLFDVAYVDVRLITAAALILPAFVRLRLPERPVRYAVLASAVAIILINDGVTIRSWIARQQDFREIKASFAKLQPGAAVLVGRENGLAGAGVDYSPLYYAPTLAAPAAGVFVSSLYSQRGMQPVEKAPRFRDLEISEAIDYVPPTVSSLMAAAAPAPDAVIAQHLRRWPDRYQYLYLIGRPQPNPLAADLLPIARGARFVLYRIRDR